MGLDAQIEQVLGFVKKAAHPEFHKLTPAAARAQYARQAPVLDFKPLAMWRVEDVAHGAWRARIYTPREPQWSNPLPVLLYIHGGGFTIGSPDTHNGLTRYLAQQADCIVVSLDYRLAPDHKFPAAVDDAFAAWQWVQREIAAFGGDPQRCAIGGDSAGGTLSAVTCLQAREAGLAQPRLQMLIYPGASPKPDTPSHLRLADGYLLTRPDILWFFDHYLRGEADRHDWRFAPLAATDLRGLAPAYVTVAEYDPLMDEGLAYAERLRQAGNAVELTLARGMVHGYFNFGGFVAAAKHGVDDAVAALRRAFG